MMGQHRNMWLPGLWWTDMACKGYLVKTSSHEMLDNLYTTWGLAMHLGHSLLKQHLCSISMRVQGRRKP